MVRLLNPSLTVGALIGAPTVREGFPARAQYYAVGALAGVYCEWRHSKNAETAKALLLNLVGCGFSLRTRITPLGVGNTTLILSLIHISEPTRLGMISYAVFCLKKKKQKNKITKPYKT